MRWELDGAGVSAVALPLSWLVDAVLGMMLYCLVYCSLISNHMSQTAA